jgi:hypothetical protein
MPACSVGTADELRSENSHVPPTGPPNSAPPVAGFPDGDDDPEVTQHGFGGFTITPGFLNKYKRWQDGHWPNLDDNLDDRESDDFVD